MIKAWNKDGKEIEIEEKSEMDDEDFAQFKMLLAMVSQECKEIVTKLRMENKDLIFIVEQK